MTSDISVRATMTIGSESDQIKGSAGVSYTSTTSSYFGNVQKIGTSYGAINVYGLTNIRYLYCQNASTASIQIAQHSASSSFATLQEGDFVVLPPSASVVTYYAKSTEANAELKVVASDN